MYEMCVMIQYIGIILLLVGLAYLLQQWPSRPQSFMLFLGLAVLVNSVGYLLEMTADSLKVALAAAKFSYMGKIYIPPLAFFFVLYYCGIKVPRVLAVIFIIGVVVACVCVTVLYAYGNSDNVTHDEDAVIVLGAGIRGEKIGKALLGRLKTTVEYCEKNPNAVVVVSGGMGDGESITEALAMERYLIENGIPQEKIIKEERATSTKENFEYSKKLLDSYFDGEYSVTFITSEFHVYRAGIIAKSEGYNNATYVGSHTLPYLIVPNGFRECLAVLKTWILG